MTAEELLKKYGIQLHDLEYILNFMQKENITPQLAMRRIKLFEKLQEKLTKSQATEKAEKMSELDHLSKMVEELQAERKKLVEEKERLLKEIEDAKLQQDLFQAEREELKMQMMALMDSIKTMEDGETKEEEELKNELKELKRKLGLITAGVTRLKEELSEVEKNGQFKVLAMEVKKALELLAEGEELPRGGLLKIPAVVDTVIEPVEKKAEKDEIMQEVMEETITPEEIKFVKPTAISSKTSLTRTKETIPKPPKETKTEKEEIKTVSETTKREKVVQQTKRGSKPVIKEKIFIEPEEIEESISERETAEKEEKPVKEKLVEVKEKKKVAEPEKPETTIKEEVEKKEKTKKIDISAKPTKEKKEVPEKIEKILKLFINYVNQADTDENFKARIAAICDMEEAYIELGGLAMAQIYSYQTQGIKKKKEFERLLTSWIENGLPR